MDSLSFSGAPHFLLSISLLSFKKITISDQIQASGASYLSEVGFFFFQKLLIKSWLWFVRFILLDLVGVENHGGFGKCLSSLHSFLTCLYWFERIKCFRAGLQERTAAGVRVTAKACRSIQELA